MKRSFLLIAVTGGFLYLTLTSNSTGPASASGADVTGSPLSFAGNTTCAACHGGAAGTTSGTLKVFDQDGIEVTNGKYTPGANYTVRIMGSYSATPALPKFGLQFVALTGAANAAAGVVVSMPPNLKTTTLGGRQYVEHNAPMFAIGGQYVANFIWQAPSVNPDVVRMYACINAVNGDDTTTGDSPSGSLQLTLNPIPASVASLPEQIKISAYPNPVTTNLNIKLENAATGLYTIKIIDVAGRMIETKNVQMKETTWNISIATSNWVSGLHFVQIIKEGAQRMMPVVKH